MPQELSPDSLERIIPDEISFDGATGLDTLKLHRDRYVFAKSHLIGGSVLDMACGVGYGTFLMAADNPAIDKAVGVDVSPEAIRYASARYGSGNVKFHCADAISFRADMRFDALVSLETIEHVDCPARSSLTW